MVFVGQDGIRRAGCQRALFRWVFDPAAAFQATTSGSTSHGERFPTPAPVYAGPKAVGSPQTAFTNSPACACTFRTASAT